jgi:hypothetical protein
MLAYDELTESTEQKAMPIALRIESSKCFATSGGNMNKDYPHLLDMQFVLSL